MGKRGRKRARDAKYAMEVWFEAMPEDVETLPDGTRVIHRARLTQISRETPMGFEDVPLDQVRDVTLAPDGTIAMSADLDAGRQEP